MNARVVVAGLLAGLTIFVWEFVAHTVLPLGQVGVRPIPQQEQVLQTVAANVKEHHLYLFPWEEDSAKSEEAYRANPSGILVVTPAGRPFGFGRRLANEAAIDVVGGILAAFLAVAAGLGGASIGRRLAFGATLGAFASLAIEFSYWNWYGFPSDYVAAQLVTAVVGWSLAAIVLGWRLPR